MNLGLNQHFYGTDTNAANHMANAAGANSRTYTPTLTPTGNTLTGQKPSANHKIETAPASPQVETQDLLKQYQNAMIN